MRAFIVAIVLGVIAEAYFMLNNVEPSIVVRFLTAVFCTLSALLIDRKRLS